MSEITPVTWTQIKSQLERNTPLLLGAGNDVTIAKDKDLVIDNGAKIQFLSSGQILYIDNLTVGNALTINTQSARLRIVGTPLLTTEAVANEIFLQATGDLGILGGITGNSFRFDYNYTGAGTVLESKTMYIDRPTGTGVTNAYSLYVTKPTIGTSTNYAIYSAGDVYIDTKLGVGAATRTDSRLTLGGTIEVPASSSAYGIYADYTLKTVTDNFSTYGFRLASTVDKTKNVTNAFNMLIAAMASSGAGTITTAIGLRVLAQTIGGTNYSSYITGSATSLVRWDGISSTTAPASTTPVRWLDFNLDGAMYKIPCCQ